MNHEVFDNSVEFGAFVAFSFWFFSEFLEVASSLGHGSSEETDFNATGILAADFDVKEDLGRKKF